MRTHITHTLRYIKRRPFFSEYMCHVYVRGDNLAGVLISDHDYPHRVSHTLLTKVIA